MDIREYLASNILIADGAMGTWFDTIKTNPDICAEEGSLRCPEIISRIHKDYLDAGARFIRTNTFEVSGRLAEKAGIIEKDEKDEYLKKLILASWNIANEAAAGREDVFIAADIGPAVFASREENYDPFEECCHIIDVFLNAGAKIFNFETFPETGLITRAARYIKERAPESFVIASYSVGRSGYSSRGIGLKRMFTAAGECSDIDCVGCNCILNALQMGQRLRRTPVPENKFLMALPNSGYEMAGRALVPHSETEAEYFASNAAELISLGVNIIGGCCQTTPEHIRRLKEKTAKKPVERMRVSVKDGEEKERKYSRLNRFMKKLDEGKRVIAAELDPPYDRNAERLVEGAFALKKAGADIITLADSPLARTRADSVMLASRVKALTDADVMPHMAMRDRNRIALKASLLGAHINDIRNLLIVTGDPVPSGERSATTAVFDFNSIKFMNFIGEMNKEEIPDDPFSFGAALNQGRPNINAQAERIEQKKEAGAAWFMTQPVYSDSELEKLAYLREKCGVKILCGIMPLVSYRNALFIKNEMPGIFVPDEILNMYSPEMSREEAEETAVRISSEIMKKAEGASDGLFFITPFNRVSLITRLMETV